MWKSLVWLYSRPYLTCVWVIQEIGANLHWEVNVGHAKTVWNRVDLVASYIIMEPAFSNAYVFAKANWWRVATISGLVAQLTQWLNILYLTSSYGCLDAGDTTCGLRGLMKLPKDFHLLDSNYSKSRLEIYRDSVEAAPMNFEKAHVLLYVTGKEEPSWVSRWDNSMLFRNPFRFVDGNTKLKDRWTRNLHTFTASVDGTLPLTRSFLTAAAVSLSIGLSHKINPFEQLELLHNFVTYIAIILADDRTILATLILGDLLEESNSADGRAFGKPVWDF
ncbi:hypothetical protein IG631_20193 [Alternaria alternata]|nr:hypothetical protein IG631_20193 [Alternaria alternata]